MAAVQSNSGTKGKFHVGNEGYNDANIQNGDNIQNDEEFNTTFGCIPNKISGNFGCCGCSCINYYINPIVMTLSIAIIWSFVIWCAIDTENASKEILNWQTFVIDYFTWFYISSLVLFGSFATYLIFSKYGNIKLGPPNEPPKYSLMTWFSMLFSAGVGVGLYFFGVAEPVFHLTSMQNGTSRWYNKMTNVQAMDALNITWFHWGFTASSVYCVAALPLAYHHHVKGEPLRESVCMMPLIGKKYANGIIGHLIDLTSVIGTMFGVATSLGLGVLQINAGLKFVFNVPENLTVQLVIIWCITGAATLSVFSGLDRGIKLLSEINFSFSFLLLFFMFFAGDPFYLLNLFIQGVGYHIQWFFELTFSTQAFEQVGFYDEDSGAQEQSGWMGSWTIFYWAWWVAWAPFVGIFIAQISKGRTIREFIIGNMFVPTLFTSIWLTVFGGIGLYNELGSIQNDISCDDDDYYSTFDGNKVVKLSCFGTADMLFATLSVLPLNTVMSVLAIIGIITYFVTSSDSASHVIDVLTASGNHEPPKLQRIFWALSEGAVASVLLASSPDGNSLTSLQTASLVSALPFCVVLLFEVLSTYKTLLIHTGELKPEQQKYWKYDLFEVFNCDNFINLLFAVICPPYYQTKTRLNMIKHKKFKHTTISNILWISGYWITWFLCILFAFLDFVENGFLELSLTMYLFFVIIGVSNRSILRNYYSIDSGHILFDCLSRIFCWSSASIQENLQSYETMEYAGVQLKLNENEMDYIAEENNTNKINNNDVMEEQEQLQDDAPWNDNNKNVQLTNIAKDFAD